MRVSFNMIYSQSVSNMNSRLSELMRINEQTASLKSINRPSDDPEGTARVLDLSSSMSRMEQYLENVDTAVAWLSLADEELSQASDVLTRLEEICEQGATGTYSDDEREMIAAEARELMEELVSISNTEYAGDSIFAGSMIADDAYAMGLGATVRDGEGAAASVLSVTGEADSTVYIEFMDSGEVGVDALNYRYSTDGGDTWTEATLAAGDTELVCDGVRTTLESGSTVTASSEEGEGDGSVIWLRPAAIYQGNGVADAVVRHSGSSTVAASCEGTFYSNVTIRVDSGGTLPGPLEYSYSLDSGATWNTGYTTTDSTFMIPGGEVELASNGGSTVVAGDQFVVQPENAEIYVDISDTSSVQINNVGCDIFGGLVEDAATGAMEAVPDGDDNLLEAVGELVGYLETNDVEGVSEVLEKLSAAHENLTVTLGDIGGRENRLEFTQYNLETIIDAAEANISDIEDADITQLSTDLAKAEYAYEAVLQSSTQIMGLSLLDYI